MPAAYAREDSGAPEEEEEEERWLPLQQPQMDERQAQEVMQRAQSVPDEELGAYPGMRYGAKAAEAWPKPALFRRARGRAGRGRGGAPPRGDRRMAAADAGRGAAEGRSRAAAHRPAKAYEAEQQRVAQQKAYEAEQQRVAQQRPMKPSSSASRSKAYEEAAAAEGAGGISAAVGRI